MSRLQLFYNALNSCKVLQEEVPGAVVLVSIINQLEYLISLESGVCVDRGRLKDIILDVQAAREVEPLNLDLAELLYDVYKEARHM